MTVTSQIISNKIWQVFSSRVPSLDLIFYVTKEESVYRIGPQQWLLSL